METPDRKYREKVVVIVFYHHGFSFPKLWQNNAKHKKQFVSFIWSPLHLFGKKSLENEKQKENMEKRAEFCMKIFTKVEYKSEIHV